MAEAGGQPFAELPLPGGRSVVLWHEDCRRGLRHQLSARSVDVVVTSPPYNLGVRYRSYEDRLPREEYLRWIGQVVEAIARVLAEDGSFFLNVAGPPTDPWLPWDVARVAGERFRLQNTIHWVKSIAIDANAAGAAAGLTHDLALGHYKPVKSRRFLHGAHEYVFHFTRGGDVVLDRLAIGVPYQDKSNVGRWRSSAGDRRCRGNTWFLPYSTIQKRERDRPHPATFPPELPEYCMRLHGLERTRLVVDPFVGIGASAVAAARLGVGFHGFDLDEGYLAVARNRVLEEIGGGKRSAPSARLSNRTARRPTVRKTSDR